MSGALTFADHWKTVTGHQPKLLIFDSKVTTQTKLGQLTEAGINFITLLVGADIGIRGLLRRLGLESFGKSVVRLFRRDLPMGLVSWDVVQPLQGEAGPDAVHLRSPGKRFSQLPPAASADHGRGPPSRRRRARPPRSPI